MKMKSTILTLTVFLFFILSTESTAQSYKSAVGLRLGVPNSISFKTFINESGALEATVGTRRYGYGGFGFGSSFGYRTWIISGSYQIHKPLTIADVEGLEYYFGGGLSANFWSYDGDFRDESDTSVNLGIQGYIGLSYSFDELPINLTLDWVPTVLVNGIRGGFGAGYGSLGVRYIFSR